MAAPVGHIFGALLLLQGHVAEVAEPSAFLAGTSFPDIRYIADIDRKVTHRVEKKTLDYVMLANSHFEQGRRFHVWLDHEREKYMREHKAYRFVHDQSFSPTHMLKFIEDHLLFSKLNNFDPEPVFNHIYAEEQAFLIPEKKLMAWHAILKNYLSPRYLFNFVRYYAAFAELKKQWDTKKGFFEDLWTNVRTLGFVIYAYVQIERLSRNEELRSIIFDFYEQKLPELINNHTLRVSIN